MPAHYIERQSQHANSYMNKNLHLTFTSPEDRMHWICLLWPLVIRSHFPALYAKNHNHSLNLQMCPMTECVCVRLCRSETERKRERERERERERDFIHLIKSIDIVALGRLSFITLLVFIFVRQVGLPSLLSTLHHECNAWWYILLGFVTISCKLIFMMHYGKQCVYYCI